MSDSDILCFNVTTTLREILMECPPHLRDKTSNGNPNVAAVENDAAAGSSKAIAESSTAKPEQSTESDVETGSEMDGEDSEEEEENIEDDKNDANAIGEGSAASLIELIIQDGNLVNVSNGHIRSDQEQRTRANGLRYMVGVVNGGGKSMQWCHRNPKLQT